MTAVTPGTTEEQRVPKQSSTTAAGRGASGPPAGDAARAVKTDAGRDSSGSPAGLSGLLAKRAANWSVRAPNERLMRAQMPVWNVLMDHYFRMEINGWDKLPGEPSLLIGVHSGGSLTLDA